MSALGTGAGGQSPVRRQIAAGFAAPPPGAGDAAQLRRLLAYEELAIAVGGLALTSGMLLPATAELVRSLQRQETAHARALSALPGVTPPAPLQGRAEVQVALSAIGIKLALEPPLDERHWMTLLAELETRLEGVYYHALGLLGESGPASLAASILASEAQHSVALALWRYPGDIGLTVGSALVQGAPPPRA